MSDVVVLTLRSPLSERLEVEGLTPDRCGTLSESEIAALPVWLGSEARSLGDFFTIRGERSERLRIEGSLMTVDGLAAGMTRGEVVINGDAGRGVAAGMTGGTVSVHGSVGDDAGLAMSGGVLHVTGNAGDRLGAASPGASKGMTGGEIVVAGSAGGEAGARARRGLIAIGGDVAGDAARAMIAGTLVVLGRTGPDPGRGSRRGSLIAVGSVDVPSSYRYACTFEPPFVRLTMTYLRRRYGLAIDDRVVTGRYRRYCGDAGDPGKGEILEWIP